MFAVFSSHKISSRITLYVALSILPSTLLKKCNHHRLILPPSCVIVGYFKSVLKNVPSHKHPEFQFLSTVIRPTVYYMLFLTCFFSKTCFFITRFTKRNPNSSLVSKCLPASYISLQLLHSFCGSRCLSD